MMPLQKFVTQTLHDCKPDQKYKNQIIMLTPDILKSLATTGTLRAGVYTGNFLLITGKTPEGDPDGVSPDLCRAIAQKLGVPLKLIPFKSQDALVDAVGSNECDIGFVGAYPDRAAKVTFTPAYVEIQATYIVPEASTIKHASEVDRAGVRIAVPARSAYGLWLNRNIKHAQLLEAEGFDATIELFITNKLDALAGLKWILKKSRVRVSLRVNSPWCSKVPVRAKAMQSRRNSYSIFLNRLKPQA